MLIWTQGKATEFIACLLLPSRDNGVPGWFVDSDPMLGEGDSTSDVAEVAYAHQGVGETRHFVSLADWDILEIQIAGGR